jgi:hypothetical protein
VRRSHLPKGARTGVRRMRIPSLANTASKMPVNLLSRSRINNVNWAAPVAQLHQQDPGLLGNPGTARVRGDSEEVGATGRVFHHEQHVQPLKQQRVDTEELTTPNLPQPGSRARRVRRGCVGNSRKSSRRPAAASTRAAPVPCAGRRFGGLGAGSSVASSSPGVTARSWRR